jgi:four helix bundle protein
MLFGVGRTPGPRTFRATGVGTRQITDAGVTEAARGKGMRTMRTPLRKEILDHVFHVIELVRPIVEAIGRRDRDLASQVRRAMSSVGLNLAAFGTASGNARLRFETARGSLYEAQAGIGIAIAWGFVSEADAAAALEAIDGLGARVFGLSRR